MVFPDFNSGSSLNLLLRCSWQTVNIGDIAHTFGFLRLFQKEFPEVAVTLWPVCIDRGVRESLSKHFPEVAIVEGVRDEKGVPSTPELVSAIEKAEILVHGSGPSVVAWRDLLHWKRNERKPYVIFGVTVDPLRPEHLGNFEGGRLVDLADKLEKIDVESTLEKNLAEVISGSAAVYCRDSLSLRYLERMNWLKSRSGLAPDTTFACDLRDEAFGDAFLKSVGLEPDQFICLVPRFRWTPIEKVYGLAESCHTQARATVNARTCESDHAPMRALIVRWVEETGKKVLLCPEMTYQVKLAKELLFDPLPPTIREKVVWCDHYWISDEASSVYALALAVVSLENHSPILAIAQGVPAFYLRQPTDTIKGAMWQDLGMGDWSYEIEEFEVDDLWKKLQSLNHDQAAWRSQARSFHSRCYNLMKAAASSTIDLAIV